MPAIQEAVSAKVFAIRQAAAMINGAGKVHEGNTIASMPRLHPLGL